MLHLFHGKKSEDQDIILLDNGLFWIEVVYSWSVQEWSWYIYPRVDQKNWALSYYAFDTYTQKKQFLDLLKIQWVWWKSAYLLAMIPIKELAEKLEKFDIQYFTSFPWIWPKTAKRILVDLKVDLQESDMNALSIDAKLLKDILTSLHDLWYERKEIKKVLPSCPFDLKKKHLPEIMKRLVEQLATTWWSMLEIWTT